MDLMQDGKYVILELELLVLGQDMKFRGMGLHLLILNKAKIYC